MTETNELPKDWKCLKLGDICQIVSGNTPKGLERVSNKGDFQFYKVSDMNLAGNEIRMNVSNLKLTSEEIKNLKIKVYPKGTVIFPKRGGAILTNKKRILAQNASFDLNLMGIIPNENVSSNFLYYWFQKLDLSKIYDGSNVPQINNKNVAPLDFPMPPIKEQQTIVSKIEELLSDLDNGKQQLLTAQQQLKVYRQSLLKWAFEGKLTNKNIKEGELPKGWKWMKVSEISNVVRGGSPRPAGDPRFYDGTIPFLKVRDITKDNNTYLTTFEYTIKEAGLHKTRQIKPDTLLLSNSGATLGVPKICMIDATMNDGIAAFLDLDKRSNLYLFYFWLSKTWELRNINMGAAQPNLNTDIIKNYLVPFCSFEEQQLVVDELESKLTICDKIEETISLSLQQVETLRQSILKKAFEGKLTCKQI